MIPHYRVSPPTNPESQGMGLAVRVGDSHLVDRTAFFFILRKRPRP